METKVGPHKYVGQGVGWVLRTTSLLLRGLDDGDNDDDDDHCDGNTDDDSHLRVER